MMRITVNTNGVVEELQVKEILHVVCKDGWELVRKSTFIDSSEEYPAINIFDILYFAILKTEDDIIRNCVCAINGVKELELIDLEHYVTHYAILNYTSYVERMTRVDKKPLAYLDYAAKLLYQDNPCDISFLAINCKEENTNSKIDNKEKLQLIE